jgi:hypothetical protein
MRRAYGGVKITIPSSVWIFDPDLRRPVFHARRTCRLPRGEYPGYPGARSALGLPARHAIRFARPCRICWPELRDDPQLELELLEGPLISRTPVRGGS